MIADYARIKEQRKKRYTRSANCRRYEVLYTFRYFQVTDILAEFTDM